MTMTPMQDWLITLTAIEADMFRETGTRPRIEMTVHSALLADIEKCAELPGMVCSDESNDGAFHVGHDVVVRSWPHWSESLRAAAGISAIGCENEMLTVQRDAALSMLDRIMTTLAFSAGSPSEQAIYAEARQLLAENGRGGVPKEMRDAYEKWEAGR